MAGAPVPTAWRAAMVVFVLCGTASAVLDWWGPFDAGTFGLEFRPTETRSQVVVLGVEAGSAAAEAGIIAGDSLTLQDRSLHRFQTVRVGESARVLRDGDGRIAVLTARNASPRGFDVLWAVIRLVTIAVAVFVASKRPRLVAARALALFLASLGLLSNWDAYPGHWSEAGLIARQAAMVFGFPFFVVFAATFSGSAAAAFVRRYRLVALFLGGLLCGQGCAIA